MDKYHTTWLRFCAAFIDGLIFWPLEVVDSFLSAPERSAAIIIFWNVLLYSSYWLYNVLLHARYGQTIGKRVMKIKVLDVSEERTPNFRQAFLRDIGNILFSVFALLYLVYLVLQGAYFSEEGTYNSLPGQILSWAALGWFLLEIFTMATNKKRRALHDYLAGTVVVKI
jgi:uncharacterized RDD family membrane protein YckC